MKNQYVGDVNDYVKHSLLATVVGALPGWPLALCWMLTADDSGSDGSKTGYLGVPAVYRRFNPDVFDVLARVVDSGDRRIDAPAIRGLFPTATQFLNELPSDSRSRRAYWDEVYGSLPTQSILFVDPDNGLEIAGVPTLPSY
jgi:hypothetical protein